jgi:hypothetical protein
VQLGEPTTSDNVQAGYGFINAQYEETDRYYFHPDHLGSTAYITNAQAQVVQHVEYVAFGETFFEEHLNTNQSPYLFNAKERDEETGMYYYGARISYSVFFKNTLISTMLSFVILACA